VIGAPGGQKLITSLIVRFPTPQGSRRNRFALLFGTLRN